MGTSRSDHRLDLPHLPDLGVGLFSTARWDEIAPTTKPPAHRPERSGVPWPQYLVDAVTDATKNGIDVQMLILGTPKWANGGKSWILPENPGDYGDFAAVSRKYPTVDDWMIWGEPNRTPNFQPSTPAEKGDDGPLNTAQQVAPRNYAVLLDSAYEGSRPWTPTTT